MFWNCWTTEFTVRSKGKLGTVARAYDLSKQKAQELEASLGSTTRASLKEQNHPPNKNPPKPTLFLDITDIKNWGILVFLLGFSFPVLFKKGKKGLRALWCSSYHVCFTAVGPGFELQGTIRSTF